MRAWAALLLLLAAALPTVVGVAAADGDSQPAVIAADPASSPATASTLQSLPVAASAGELPAPAAADRRIARSAVVQAAVAALLLILLLGAWVAWLLSQQRRRIRLLSRAEGAEAQARAMIEALPAVFWMLRLDRDKSPQFTVFGSQRIESIGVAASELSGGFDQVARFIPPEDRERLQQLLEHHSREQTGFRLEHRVVDAAGTLGWSYLQAVPRREKTGMVWYGCSLNITERKSLEAALEQSRSQLQELAAGVPGALWQFRCEPDGRQHYSYMSDGIVGITGRTLAETNQLMDEREFTTVHPDDVEIVKSLMQRLTEQPGIDEARYRLLTATGEWKWVQVAARAMPVGADGALVWNGVTLDATRIHETEAALRYERQRIQDLADNLSGALWRMRRSADGQYRFDYVSEGVLAVAGRTARQIMEEQIQPIEVIVDEDRPRVIAALERSAASGDSLELEYSVHAAPGRIERLFARAAVRIENGEPVWTGVLLNVSERHRLQAQLADARSRIEDIAGNFPGAIFQLLRDPQGKSRYTYVSAGITSLTGRPPRTAEGRELLENYDHIHPEDRDRVRAESQRMIDGGGSVQFDYRLIDASGAPRWVHCAMTARPQADGSTTINGLLLNAEEAKRLESELRAASQRAEAASQAKTRFLANMSHEIRTPMNAVIGLAHIAMTSETNPMQAERIGKIHRAGKALLKLLNDILEYSRLEAGKLTPVVAAFDLNELLAAVKLFCAPAADTKGLAFTVEGAEAVAAHWFGDATRIQQVLLNLLSNAIKFTDAGSVCLKVQALGGAAPGLCFTVSDSGIGMTPAELQRVFEAFEQANDDTERRHGGSGLGLSISRELVVALGGRISVESVAGQGTVFTVELPLAAAAEPASQRATARPRGDLAPRLARLADQLGQRDAAGARNSLSALRLLLIPQGRDRELHALERLLAGFDIEAAQVELARLGARWGLATAADRRPL